MDIKTLQKDMIAAMKNKEQTKKRIYLSTYSGCKENGY